MPESVAHRRFARTIAARTGYVTRVLDNELEELLTVLSAVSLEAPQGSE